MKDRDALKLAFEVDYLKCYRFFTCLSSKEKGHSALLKFNGGQSWVNVLDGIILKKCNKHISFTPAIYLLLTPVQ